MHTYRRHGVAWQYVPHRSVSRPGSGSWILDLRVPGASSSWERLVLFSYTMWRLVIRILESSGRDRRAVHGHMYLYSQRITYRVRKAEQHKKKNPSKYALRTLATHFNYARCTNATLYDTNAAATKRRNDEQRTANSPGKKYNYLQQ